MSHLAASRPDVRPLTREEVRDVDRRAIEDYGMTGLVLMENAGRNAAALLRTIGINGPVAICCGKGNNGGDGFVIARHLENAGFDIRVMLCAEPRGLTGDAAANYRILEKGQTPIIGPPVDWQRELANVDWIVDALLGTGTQGPLREPFLSVIEAINAAGRNVLAIDLPSGMDCDTGKPLGACVRALHTVTFVSRKVGFNAPGASQWTGEVHVADIGAPRKLLQEL